MARYENKLVEWFKQVEQREQELKTKKQGPEEDLDKKAPVIQQTWESPVEQVESIAQVASVAVMEPVRTASATAVATAMETTNILADSNTLNFDDFAEMTSQPREITASPMLFEDGEAPHVDDFFAFLDRSETIADDSTFSVVEESRDRGIGHLSEGTGHPRPISPSNYLSTTPVLGIEKIAEVVVPPIVPTFEPVHQKVAAPKPKSEAKPKVARKIENSGSLQEKWDRMPHHLQTLFGVNTGEEVAQNSYKTFRENRGVLIQRLLDPPITLEEAARVLNVCPTTVRRYTNRGILKHFRTAGNQRRFRLSDVLTFMETKGKSISEDS